MEIKSRLEFSISSRGWCYLLEEYGLGKGDFDATQKLINDCRKSGHLPLDLCAEDGSRSAENLDEAGAWENEETIEDEVESELRQIEAARQTAINSAGDPRVYFSWYAADFTTDRDFEGCDQEQRANPSMESWPEGRAYLDLVNAGLADLKASGRWFEVVSRHLGAFGVWLR